jgi:hypothetical protein
MMGAAVEAAAAVYSSAKMAHDLGRRTPKDCLDTDQHDFDFEDVFGEADPTCASKPSVRITQCLLQNQLLSQL